MCAHAAGLGRRATRTNTNSSHRTVPLLPAPERISKFHLTFERYFCWLLRACVPLLALGACVPASLLLSLISALCLRVSCLLASLLPVVARRPPSSRSTTPSPRVSRHKRVCFSAHGPASCRRRTRATTEHRRCEDVRAGSRRLWSETGGQEGNLQKPKNKLLLPR